MVLKKRSKRGSGSASGKLMLFGEHSVVYGYPCIVLPVVKKIYVEAIVNKINKDKIITNNGDPKFVIEAFKVFRQKFNINDNLTIKIITDFSDNYGFGSSSAVTVATIKALTGLYSLSLSKKQLFRLCYRIVLNIQKVGSGFDVAAAVYDKIIYYQNKGEIIKPLKTQKINLVVGYSGVKADTVELIQKLKIKYQNDKSKIKINKIFNSITDIVKKARNTINKQDWQLVGELMTKNHELLKQLEVSTQKLDAMVNAAINAGAYGAKLSGAGGGDCMIALVSNKTRSQVEKAIEEVGGEIISI